MKTLQFSDMPTNWTVCLFSQCPRHDSCLRFRATSIISQRHHHQYCVMPTALNDNGCSYYVQDALVPVAWGMKTLFQNVRPEDARQMRPFVKGLFKSHSTFYRYYNGRYPVSPNLQDAIRRIFQCFGYKPEKAHFDRVEMTYYFPLP